MSFVIKKIEHAIKIGSLRWDDRNKSKHIRDHN